MSQEFGENAQRWETFYSSANGNVNAVPWSFQQAHPLFVEWLEQKTPVGNGQSALVVGCGIGDDAEALAVHGYAVTAFDISPTAVAWCKDRFPNSSVDYQVADLLSPPDEWFQSFDFVLENRTVQAMPIPLHRPAIARVGDLVAAGGTLLIICWGRNTRDAAPSVPFPLTREELSLYEKQDLTETEFVEIEVDRPHRRRFRVEYSRPQAG